MILNDGPPRRFDHPWPQSPQTHRQRHYPPRQRTVGPNVKRLGTIYGFNTLDPDTGTVGLGYVGQTFQQLWQREAQHRMDQPWSDLIVGQAFVIAQGMWTCDEIDQIEKTYIRTLRPTYNYEHNLDNPNRIPIYEARRQRAERDAARGVPVWAPPSGRPSKNGRRRMWPVWMQRAVGRWRRRATRAAVRVFWLALAWLLVAAAVWLLHPASVPAGTGARDGAVVASAGLVAAFVAKAKKPRRRRRRRR